MSVEVTGEPLTYEPHASRSYFRDRTLALRGDTAANARLEKHGHEMDVELPAREARARLIAAQNGVEFRVNPNRTPGQGGYFAPPLWLIGEFANVPRAGRVLGNLVTSYGLPAGVQSIGVPRVATGPSVSTAADDGTASDTDLTDAGVVSPVMPITGAEVVGLQLLEQSPPGAHLDAAVFKMLAEAYDEQLEVLMLYGSGSGTQFTGVVPAAGTTVTYTSGAPVGGAMYTAWCQMNAQVGDARRMPPQAFLVRTARWQWLAAQGDSQNRPFIPPGTPPPAEYRLDGQTSHGTVAGVPAFFDDAIASNLGAGTNQDEVIACRPDDLLLMEGDPRVVVNLDTGVSGTLQARLEFRSYAAFLAGRYPTGIGVTVGTGHIVQAGY